MEQDPSLFQLFCICCIRASLRDDRVTNHELQRFEKFRLEVCHDFDKGNEAHEAVLKHLYELYFGNETQDEELKTEAWRQVGF